MKKVLDIILKIIKFILKFIGIILLILILSSFIIGIYFYNKYKPIYDEYSEEARIYVEKSTEETFLTDNTTYIFNDNKKILRKLNSGENSDYLKYEDINGNIVNAFVAVEDRSFWEHNGIDLKGIIRILYRYIKTNGNEMHGASTITQQLARRTFLSNEVSLERKLKEMLYAMEMEKKYSKEQIIEFYINDIYYANNYYGFSAAAKGYFNKTSDELSLSEIAYICAIPNAPAYYDPIKNKDRAIKRRDKILGDMLECGYISEENYNKAIKEEIILDTSGNKIEFSNYQATYATECAVRYLMKLNNFYFRYEFEDNDDYKKYLINYDKAYKKAYNELTCGGYKIYTSLNDEKQAILQEAIDEGMQYNKEITKNNLYDLQSAATLINNETRKVEAIVGGRTQYIELNEKDVKVDNNIYSLNRGYQSFRQPGSSIKPLIVYTPGLEIGFTPYSILYNVDVDMINKLNGDMDKENDIDIETLTGTPYNYRKAVEKSVNGCAYYVYNKVGIENGIKRLQKMKFKKIVPDDYYMPAALGGITNGVSTEEMANAYSTLANYGLYNDSTCITSIIDKNGEEIYIQDDPIEVYKPNSAKCMLDILKGVITDGTASKSINWEYNIDIAGKTGTTNESKDGWFCGISNYYSLAVWVGYDQPKKVDDLTGGGKPAEIWCNVMTKLHKNKEDSFFEPFSYGELLPKNDLYYSFLPEKEDDEVVIDGYLVSDYRIDRVLGNEILQYVAQLNAIQITNQNDINKGNDIYETCLFLIENIKDKNYKTEVLNVLNTSYAVFNENIKNYNQFLLNLQLLMQQQMQPVQNMQ